MRPKSPKSTKSKLTELEGIIMDAIWTLEQASVRDVQDYLMETRPMARNTVQTMLCIMRDKGFLKSKRVDRADVYRPTITREKMNGNMLRDMVNQFFSGSARALVSQLLETEELDSAELKAIRKELNRHIND